LDPFTGKVSIKDNHLLDREVAEGAFWNKSKFPYFSHLIEKNHLNVYKIIKMKLKLSFSLLITRNKTWNS
jgi:hypothetical protein